MKISKQDFNFGFTKNSENLNGRIAMLSIILIILIELILKKSIFSFM